jgi:glucosamine kinase
LAYFLAVDAGGTKTDYLLADESQTLVEVRGGSIKRLRVCEEEANANLEDALRRIESIGGIDLAEVHATCVGAAGYSVPLVRDWLHEAFEARVAGRLEIVEDVEIALDAAFFGGTGILVLAGTGSNVAGRDAQGRLTSAGGWGPTLADHGSGYALGHAALRETFLAIDEGRESTLLEEILRFWNLHGIPELVELANRDPKPDLSQLALIVAKCADQGDAAALRVIDREAAALAHLVEIVAGRLRLHAPTVAFTGSIMEHIPSMRRMAASYILDHAPDAHLLPGVISPIQGALWRARL